MLPRFRMLGMSLLVLVPHLCRAAPPTQVAAPAKPTASLPLSNADELAGSLRGYLVRQLPNPLYEASPGWGHQRKGFRGVKWHGKVLPLRPAVMRGDENQGVWRKVRVSAVNLPDTLIFDLRNVRQIDEERTAFDLFLAFDARVDYTQQTWEAGIKLFDGSTRARFRVRLLLNCEATARLETGSGLLPEVVFRLRVTNANLQYDNFVTEHIAGVGGEAAKVLGDAVRDGVKDLRPALERELLARANAAIVKAGDTKEVRISLASIFGGKGAIGKHR